ncbi:MazG nucleotide pyrophosphohydrolase domain-containing protein [Glutamicibacter uratoxydans]|uniref:MazG nucleotide pyrophosphohydrolase domain-containing protein n=1 Tax=Glutamicibacter uratoxydans TaxID=43667 RepID=UPI003D6E3B3B
MSTAPHETQRLLEIIDNLRTHCAWTRALDHASLRHYLVEESYEVIDAIAHGDAQALAEELGDLLLQILLHARIAEETGAFDYADVVRGLSEKMLRRNRHIFDAQGQLRENVTQDIAEIIRIWDAAKAEERQDQRPRAGLPAGLPALSLSQKLLSRRRRSAESAEIIAWMPTPELEQITDEASLARMLLAVTTRASELGLDAESVLRDALLTDPVGSLDETTSPETPTKR